MVILFIWIIVTIILIIIMLSQLKLSVHNKEDINYVKVSFLMFTANLDYNRFMKTVRRLGVQNDFGFKDQIHLYQTLNPLFKDIAKQTVIEKANFYKFFDEYSQTYKVITFYLLSSYLNSFFEFNCKRLKDYSYTVVYSNEREDLDFSFICNIRLINIFYVMLKNLKILFKYYKGRKIHGS